MADLEDRHLKDHVVSIAEFPSLSQDKHECQPYMSNIDIVQTSEALLTPDLEVKPVLL